jgi:hypothetical protein
MSEQRKSSNVDLPAELAARNIDGKYDKLIERAKNNWYHDFKNPDHVPDGKMQLIDDLSRFPELNDIRMAVMDGDYDDSPDAADKADMRKDLPPSMWGMLGLNPDQE